MIDYKSAPQGRWFVVGLIATFATAVSAVAFGSSIEADRTPDSSSAAQPLVVDVPDVTEPTHPEVAMRDFPTNKSGMTYGSDAVVPPGEAPDLIAVVGDKGIFGFCLKEELYPSFDSPKEAAAYQAAHAGEPESCTVYDSEGKVALDVSTAVDSTVSYDSRKP